MEIFYAQVIGQVVRATRAVRRIELATLATALEMSSSGWSRVETGESVMTVSQLRRAATALEVEPWALVQQADALCIQLAQRGIIVNDKRPAVGARVALSAAAILAIVAGDATSAVLGKPAAAKG